MSKPTEPLPPWINAPAQIPDASIASLRRSLITSDGGGKKLKEAVLDELLKRVASGC